ncbi:MCE family protein [uncultured Mycolicibacterium sp.]|uniref:MCE family protein n=1 Tax=uncultured Mycolicibacterium sp. TaxID=2320817 RepID=UPI0026079AE5|nr:MCE family protein [uncultured Mycolicibacterium sp.]
MTTQPNPTPLNKPRTPPYRLAGLILVLVAAVAVALVWAQFRGEFSPRAQLYLVAPRAGLVMDPGSKVTLNGVEIGRVSAIEAVTVDGEPRARITLDVDPRYLDRIPLNVAAEIKATTVFGNKYVSLSSPAKPAPETAGPGSVLYADAVTTEFNSLFETVVEIAEQVDPVKLNQTLAATAQALQGLGDRFGEAIVDGNAILADLNPRMPQIRYDIQRLADVAEVYSAAAPDLFDALGDAVTTAGTLNAERRNLDQALMAAAGFGNNAGEIFERSGPYLVRGAEDLVVTTELLDRHSPALFCTVRNWHDVAPKIAASLGGNGYSLRAHAQLLGAANPYIYPDNLPRTNARGGPEGRPGCWQPITRDLWPAPYLVMDTGASIAPYNHIELGQPLATEYVWGRQIGEYTINP